MEFSGKMQYPITLEYLTFHECFIQRMKEGLEKECGLTISHFRVLSCLEQANRALRVNELADHLQQSNGATTYIVTKLENRGLVCRSYDEKDLRSVYVEKTDAGEKALHKAYGVCSAVTEKLMDLVGDDLRANTEARFRTSLELYKSTSAKGTYFADKTYLSATLLYKHLLDETLHSFNATLSGVRIVLELSRHLEGMKTTELSKSLLMKLSKVTTLGNELVEQGYVSRKKDVVDRRATVLSITREGLDFITLILPEIDSVFMQSATTATAQEREADNEVSRIVIQQLRRSFRCT